MKMKIKSTLVVCCVMMIALLNHRVGLGQIIIGPEEDTTSKFISQLNERGESSINAAVDVSAEGEHFVAWQSQTAPVLYARLMDESGDTITGELEVSTAEAGIFDNKVTVLGSGRFLVTWWEGDPNGALLYGRIFNTDEQLFEDDAFLIADQNNEGSLTLQYYTYDVSAINDNRFAVCWSGQGGLSFRVYSDNEAGEVQISNQLEELSVTPRQVAMDANDEGMLFMMLYGVDIEANRGVFLADFDVNTVSFSELEWETEESESPQFNSFDVVYSNAGDRYVAYSIGTENGEVSQLIKFSEDTSNVLVADRSLNNIKLGWHDERRELVVAGSYEGVMYRRFTSELEPKEDMQSLFGMSPDAAYTPLGGVSFAYHQASQIDQGSVNNVFLTGIYPVAETLTSGEEEVVAEMANRPDVAADGNGRYVVVWQSQEDWQVYAQLYDVNGDALLEVPLQVNEGQEISVESSVEPQVDMNRNGAFVVVWNDRDTSFENHRINARKYNSEGMAHTEVLTVIDDGIYVQPLRVSMNDEGDFWTAWGGTSSSEAPFLSWCNYTMSGDSLGKVSTEVLDIEETVINVDITANNDRFTLSRINDQAENLTEITFQQFTVEGDSVGEQVTLEGVALLYHTMEMDENGDMVLTGISREEGVNGYIYEYWQQRYDQYGTALGERVVLHNQVTLQLSSDLRLETAFSGEITNTTTAMQVISEDGVPSILLQDVKMDSIGQYFDLLTLSEENTLNPKNYPGVAYIDDRNVVAVWEETEFMQVRQRRFQLPEEAAIAVEETNDTTYVPEGGRDSIYVSLTILPLEQVIVGLTAEYGGYQLLNADGEPIDSLTFEAGDTDPQLVVLYKEDDRRIDESFPQSLELSPVSIDDPNYTEEITNAISVMVGENDSAGVVIEGPDYVAEGDTAYFDVNLQTIPLGQVCIGFSTNMEGQTVDGIFDQYVDYIRVLDEGEEDNGEEEQSNSVCFGADSSALAPQTLAISMTDDNFDLGDTLDVTLAGTIPEGTDFYNSDITISHTFKYIDNDELDVEFEFIPQYAREGGNTVMVVATLNTLPNDFVSLQLEEDEHLQIVQPNDKMLTFGIERGKTDTFYVRATEREGDQIPGYYKGYLTYEFFGEVGEGFPFATYAGLSGRISMNIESTPPPTPGLTRTLENDTLEVEEVRPFIMQLNTIPEDTVTVTIATEGCATINGETTAEFVFPNDTNAIDEQTLELYAAGDPEVSGLVDCILRYSFTSNDEAYSELEEENDVVRIRQEQPAEPGDEPREISIYNAISADGDGRNDYLHIEHITDYENNKVSVFNKWGDLITDIEKYDNTANNWKPENDIEPGTYYVVVHKDMSTGRSGNNIVQTYVVLKR